MNWLSIPWGAFLRAFRLHALVLTTAVFLGGALFWGAFNGSLEITNTETFCISCHAMKEYVFKEYRNSGHYNNRTGVRASCPDCDVPREWIHKVRRKVLATNELFHWLAGSIDTPQAFEAKRSELARRVWAGMRATDSRECRNCHGLDFMLVDGEPRLFDAIEFSDRFAYIDVLCDLSFLLMDLIHHDLADLANAALNRYLWYGNGLAGLALLPVFLSCAAAIRAHVGAATAETVADTPAAEAARTEARRFLARALSFLDPTTPRLVAVGGLSGSGKTTLAMGLARALGAAPGALVIRSDVIRKRLLGVDVSERLPAEAYAPRISTLVYQTIQDQAAIALGAGNAVIADAVYARSGEREGIEAVARRTGVPFDGLWLKARREVMARRIETRRNDASDATPAVLDEQLGFDVADVAWIHVNGDGSREAALVAARRALLRPLPRHAAS